MSIVIAVLMFGLIILVHELGHFVAAKASGITVLQFSIGFGPAIFKKQVGETLYAVRIIPLGGAVMMKGTDDEEAILVGGKGENADMPADFIDPDPERGSYHNAAKLQRLVVCAAGSVMNLITGILIILIILMPVSNVQVAHISGFMDGFPYQEYFRPGDEIVKINSMRIYVYNDVSVALSLGEGKPYDLVVRREGKTVELSKVALSRTVPDADGDLRYGFVFTQEPIGFGGKVKYALNNTMSFLQSAVQSLKMLVSGQASAKDMIGTVGIANEISSRARQSMANTWYFVAFISINLAFMNMLPIPALDGGKILFLIIEAIRGKRISEKVEGIVSMASLVLILGLFVFVTYNDIVKIIAG